MQKKYEIPETAKVYEKSMQQEKSPKPKVNMQEINDFVDKYNIEKKIKLKIIDFFCKHFEVI